MSSSSDGVARAAGERLELRVSVSGGDREQDVLISAGADDRLGDLARAIAEDLHASTQLGLWCERRGEHLGAELRLANAGIRWGDRLLLVPPAAEPTHVGGIARVELVVSGGPCAGERFELGEGSYRLGREPDMDVCLSDPSLSRHHLNLVVEAAAVKVADASSRNGTAVNGQALRPETARTLREHDELEIGRSLLRIRALGAQVDHGVVQRDGRLDFNRQPRIASTSRPFSRELPAPPSRRRKGRLPLAASLVPLGAGLLLFVLLKSPVMLAIAGLSPMMAVSTYLSDRRGGKKSFARESLEFRDKLERALQELDEAREEEAIERRAESPDAPTLITWLSDLAPELWERRPADSDFLSLRIGVADLTARSVLTVAEGGEQDIRAEAEAEIERRSTIPSVPLVVEARKAGVIGLAGAPAATAGLARWLLIQATVLHSPGELVVMAALTRASAPEWSWLKWLPHLRPDRLGLQSPAIAIDRQGAEALLAEVRELVRERRARARAQGGTGARPPQLVLLIDEQTEVDRALVSAALTDVAEHSIVVLWLGADQRNLPGQTGAIIVVEDQRTVLSLTDVASGERIEEASADALTLELAGRTARMLAPVRDISELARAGDIPKRVGLLDLLGLLPPSAESLQRRWEAWQGRLRATIGVSADGLLEVDLRSEGPHALIAGTTGSGKSELLRTLVAAMAAEIPPHRLSFLLVDYKGGAAFAPCAALPHVVDIVSDLDEHLAERALISLNAELKRRERILAQHGAKDLLDLSARDPDSAPPLLVIAVDEFAKLREEVPDFVDGVVDIAQRGRSLGVHMVLAAQTLRNAFTPAIRANTNLRVALRVSEESESEDMIASPLAARIPSGEASRGRALIRTGHGELREFQAAYVSGLSDLEQQRELQIEAFQIDTVAMPQGPSADDSDAESDLLALGEAAREAQAQMGLPTPSPPWLAMLPTLLSLGELGDVGSPDGGVAIGLVDLPHLQRQDQLTLDFSGTGHVAVFGAGNSGKTTVLTSTALALAQSSTPERLSIYGLDAAGGGLSPLQALSHCGGIVNVEEEERVHRLLRMLCQRIELRGTRSDHAHAQGEEQPASTVLLLDDFGSFAHHYDKPGLESPYEQLQQILAGGRAAGIHVILSASRRGALPSALAAHIGQRLVLRMPTEEDMLSLGLDAKTVRGVRLPVGRGFTQETHEFQIAVPTQDEEALALARAVAAISPDRPSPVERVDVLPADVSLDSLRDAVDLAALPLGLSDENLQLATLDLSEMHLLVVGPYRSGRSTTLTTIAHGVRQVAPSTSLHLLSPRRSQLRDLDYWDSAASGPEACTEAAVSLLESLESGELGAHPSVVVIDDAGEISDARAVTQLERLIRLSRDSELKVVAAVETGSARGIGNSWIRELRREGHGLLLQPDLASDGDLLGTRLPRRIAAPLLPGRGFLVVRGTAELVQVAH